MKISKIHIHNYYQFQDFELDLTYPKGHPKDGKPLDKVCFIGQSGTGKTTLLNVINTVVNAINYRNPLLDTGNLQMKGRQRIDVILNKKNNEKLEYRFGSKGFDRSDSFKPEFDEILIPSLLYFPANLNSIIIPEIEEENVFRVEEDRAVYRSMRSSDKFEYYVFDEATIEKLWQIIQDDVVDYQSEEANYKLALFKKLEEGELKENVADLMKIWRAHHPNILEQIANECLNELLNRFNLRVKTEIDNVKEVSSLQISPINSNDTIPYHKLSSGTRQIMLTAFPIYRILRKDSIVLMDQPEDSLYPDVQKELIPYYTSFDKEKQSQFFFATHSPIIASSFEPWEIVELKFDSDGKVYRELYYDSEKENHVENYRIDPRYLRWDSILMKVFDLNVDSNVEHRSKMLMEFSILKQKIEMLEEEGKLKDKSPATQKLIDDYLRVGELLDWEIE